MGMYSYFKDEDIEVLDANLLADWLEEEFKKNDNYVKYLKVVEDDGGETYGSFKDDVGIAVSPLSRFIEKVRDISKGKSNLSFCGFDDMKIISYWYDDFVSFLRDIAVFIDGRVGWDFENDDEAGCVVFENGEATITAGRMIWTDYKPDEIREELQEQSEKLKATKMLLRKL